MDIPEQKRPLFHAGRKMDRMKFSSLAIYIIASAIVVCGLIQMSKGDPLGYKLVGVGIIMGFIHTWMMVHHINRRD